MMLWTAALLLLAACSPAQQQAPEQAAANGCPASSSSVWTTANAGEFHIEASISGPNCAQATATLSVRDAAGGTRWTEAFPVGQVMTLAGARSAEDMQAKLAEWIDPANATYSTSADLPEWTLGEDNPMSGEFAFYPADGFDRAAYEALRARAAPVFCYVQGMESLACLAWESGELEQIGLQTFPG